MEKYNYDSFMFGFYYWGRNPIMMRKLVFQSYLAAARERITKEEWKILKSNYDYLMENYHNETIK